MWLLLLAPESPSAAMLLVEAAEPTAPLLMGCAGALVGDGVGAAVADCAGALLLLPCALPLLLLAAAAAALLAPAAAAAVAEVPAPKRPSLSMCHLVRYILRIGRLKKSMRQVLPSERRST